MGDVGLKALHEELALRRKVKQEAREKELESYMKVKPKVKPIAVPPKSKREVCREHTKDNETIFMRRFLFSRGWDDWYAYTCLLCLSGFGDGAHKYKYCPYCGRKIIGIEDEENG